MQILEVHVYSGSPEAAKNIYYTQYVDRFKYLVLRTYVFAGNARNAQGPYVS